VEALSCRLLPWEVADGPTNMAADEVLVRTAADQGIASLRFYGWQPATLSLGYFQPAAARLTDPPLAGLPFVRRPSGGATLVHDREVTYCLAIPPGRVWHAGKPWMARMHEIIAAAVAQLGVEAIHPSTPAQHGEVLCFQQFTAADLLCHGHKIVGSAQRKYHQALMQHGSILLAQSEHTPTLPGLRELTGRILTTDAVREAVIATFAQATGWRPVPCDWTAEERTLTRQLVAEKYATPDWNEKR
jgi:lipoate-protein ligase A